MSARMGLDLGSREVRLLEVDGRRVTRHSEILLPDGAMVDGIPSPPLTELIRGALQEQGYMATGVRVAIAETGTAFRAFTLPPLPASELSSAVRFEGRRLIPMNPDDVYFAWHAQRREKGYAIYLVAARRAMIDGVVASVRAAGLAVDRIDLKPLALARGMGVWDGLLLDWGASEATLALMADGQPHFFRTIQLDAPPDEPEAQFEELALTVAAVVKFMRGSAPEITIGPSTPLTLGGRFAFIHEGARRAEERLRFRVVLPESPLLGPSGFPWQAHFAEVGLLQQERWRSRLTPSQGGDIRVAA